MAPCIQALPFGHVVARLLFATGGESPPPALQIVNGQLEVAGIAAKCSDFHTGIEGIRGDQTQARAALRLGSSTVRLSRSMPSKLRSYRTEPPPKR